MSSMTISFNQLSGHLAHLKVKRSSTIRKLKSQLLAEVQLERMTNVGFVWLVFQGTKLVNDDMTLDEAGLPEDAEIQVIFEPPVECATKHGSRCDVADLRAVQIPDSSVEVVDRAFEDCKALAWVAIPSTAHTIGKYAFNCCSSLKRVTIPDSVIKIGKGCFQGCRELESVTISNSLQWIEDSAFKECSSLQSVVIPKSVMVIGNGAFQGCSNLVCVTLPDSQLSIEDEAFYGCRSLTKVTLPDSVKYIGFGAFGRCPWLRAAKVNIPTNARVERDAFDFPVKSESLSQRVWRSIMSEPKPSGLRGAAPSTAEPRSARAPWNVIALVVIMMWKLSSR